jgi:hypothetical protein
MLIRGIFAVLSLEAWSALLFVHSAHYVITPVCSFFRALSVLRG